MKDAVKKCIEVCTHSFIIKPYRSILTSLMMIAEDLNSGFEKKYVKVPFAAVLKFVEERAFPLKFGYVEVPLDSLKHLLAVVFEEILTQGLNQIRASDCMQELRDPRIWYMHKEIKRLFRANVKSSLLMSNNTLTEKNLDKESDNFPLCMANLHNLLRSNHRLQHTSRVQYILYLKEIGVPCQEVINLFMKEYSIPVVNKQIRNSKTCDHSWADSQNRYIYNIEHLYGNRGSRKNYRAHTCHALQNSGNSSDGGCPYACFDEKNLEKVLSLCSFEVKDIEDIKSLSSSKKYTKACHSNLLMKIKSISSNIQVNKEKNVAPNFSKNLSCSEDNNKVLVPASALNSNGQVCRDSLLCELSKPSDFYFFIKNLKFSAICYR
ncbi:DNA primase large subunit like protein [Argiope bruennichi]|uniref:DNA primase large subunit like protein n=1 Tax=Argiope bruennichi TaxID=94029 RepID=A0A8T0F1V0_ARGBR|nr:DNA primase large subunit like protein [Argiope bruennichi]